jgi:hypothetical protein
MDTNSEKRKLLLRRRTFLQKLGLGSLWCLLPSFVMALPARGESVPPLIDSGYPVSNIPGHSKKESAISKTFTGEVLAYDVSFLWFKNAAKATISFHKKKEGGYLASIEAETFGFIGWVSNYRKDSYFSHLEESDNGKLLISNLFEYQVTIGNKTRKSHVTFDYENQTMIWESRGGGKPDSLKKEKITPGVRYDDPLVAFYNFRYAAYGPLEEGKEFHISTFPKKGVSTIFARINTEKEMKKRLHTVPEHVKYLVDTRLEKELFGSQSGDIEILFSKDFIPLTAIVKDIILFGDIRGVLTSRRFKH